MPTNHSKYWRKPLFTFISLVFGFAPRFAAKTKWTDPADYYFFFIFTNVLCLNSENRFNRIKTMIKKVEKAICLFICCSTPTNRQPVENYQALECSEVVCNRLFDLRNANKTKWNKNIKKKISKRHDEYYQYLQINCVRL